LKEPDDAADAGDRKRRGIGGLLHKIIGLMQRNTLDEVLNEPEVKATFETMYENHTSPIEVMRGACEMHRRRD